MSSFSYVTIRKLSCNEVFTSEIRAASCRKKHKGTFRKRFLFFFVPIQDYILGWGGIGRKSKSGPLFCFQEEDQKSDGKELHQAQVERSVPIE